MAGCTALRAVLVLIVIPLLVAAAPGATAVIGPGNIGDRGTVFLNLSGVTNGTVLNTTLTAVFPPAPGVTWLNLTNWNYPFALRGGRVGVGGQNVNRLILFVRTGGAPLMAVNTGAGNISVEIPVDLQPFTFYDFRIGYEVHNAQAPLAFTLYQQGMKAGSLTEANITPSVNGIGEGKLTIAVFANGSSVGKQEIPVLKAGTVTTSPANTTTPEPANATPSAPATPSVSPPPTSGPATPVTTVALPPTSLPPATTATAPPAGPAAPAEAPGPSPFIIGFAVVIILFAAVADYLLLKD